MTPTAILLLVAGIYFAFKSIPGGGSSAVDAPDAPDVIDGITSQIGGIFAMNALNFSNAAVDLTQSYEGCSLVAYPDARGYSIGRGHFGAHKGDRIDQATADAYFDEDLGSAASTVNGVVTVPLSQPQFDALTDFCYNVGMGHFLSSTLLKMLNAGDYTGAASQFGRWIYEVGEVSEDLIRRRRDETAIFLSGTSSDVAA